MEVGGKVSAPRDDGKEGDPMILPTIRASFGRRDALHLASLLGGDDPGARRRFRERLEESGLDALLDDPRTLNALLTASGVEAPPGLVFYVLVRHALLESGLDDRKTADFVASLVVAFGRSRRAYRISDEDRQEFHYLVDMVVQMGGAREERAFLLRSHLGNFSLWLAGLFPDFLDARTRRGAPPLAYYESMGRTGYRLAAESSSARSLGVEDVFRTVARDFSAVRTALNRMSDRHLWAGSTNPVGRLLREVTREAPS
jgi:hypothetical protein